MEITYSHELITQLKLQVGYDHIKLERFLLGDEVLLLQEDFNKLMEVTLLYISLNLISDSLKMKLELLHLIRQDRYNVSLVSVEEQK